MRKSLGRHAAALDDLNRVVELDAEYEWGLVERGELLMVLGRNEEALTDFHAVLRQDPQYAWVRYLIGLVRWGQGNETAAIADFAAATEIERELAQEKPQVARHAFNVAVYLAAQGFHDDALAQLWTTMKSEHSATDVEAAIEDFEKLHRTTGRDTAAALSILRTE
ncbi:tetratricopeptide repeat protein [Amycolatopsis lexingtonensis]|uniref:tetratricopeptide repeat protein n=1 Tax=Amycolatopsis lexingtonensis TaxID=218822 RepID=UPI003F709F44